MLLLEEGGPPPPASDPQFFHNLIGYDGRTSINNLFVSVPQSNAGLENKGVSICIYVHINKFLVCMHI